MTVAVRFQKQDLPLSGTPPVPGERPPSVLLSKSPMETVELAFPRDRPLLLTTAPSVDTPVCANQLQLFDQKLRDSGADLDLWFVTRDLPFALQRFVQNQSLESVQTFSDFKHRHLGDRFGLEIPSMGLLARTVFVFQRDGEVIYREIVSEISALPDLDAAWSAAIAL
jgi:thioredoxin-dependent peroxiredoxin